MAEQDQSSRRSGLDRTVGRRPTVLIVDDQPSVRRIIRHALERDGRVEVIGEASDPYEARGLIKALDPNVITLDVEMPRMTGLEFLERIMRLRLMPVVLFSSVTQHGSDKAVKALSLGAADVLAKPLAGLTPAALSALAESVFAAAHMPRGAPRFASDEQVGAPTRTLTRWNGRIVLVGASTGGVAAIETILRALPANMAPIVIAQHMPESFLASFAARMDAMLPHKVELARPGAVLETGRVYLAPGGHLHTGVHPSSGGLSIVAIDAPKRNGHIPSVDELFLSACNIASRITAVLLTGIGKDGAEGLKALRDKGSFCIGQDEATSVVFGMPRVAAEMGAVDVQLPIDRIAQAVLASCDAAERGRVR